MMQEVDFSDWTKVDYAFDFALSLPESEQLPWVDLHFSEQPELRMRTRLLLARAMRTDALFEDLGRQRDAILDSVLPETPAATEDGADLRIGAHYGPWKVIQRIGTGGLAEVYEVERDDDRYHQKAALKIMRASILSADALAMFKRERRVLASLDHPGLVRIIDGGETATGAPWLVMEHVDGVPINIWGDDNNLEIPARLNLLADAADALQAAHSRLILHGDIKPDHVVVVNGGGIKLLDFGIAQLLDDDGVGAMAAAVTPATASPEQRYLSARPYPAAGAGTVRNRSATRCNHPDGVGQQPIWSIWIGGGTGCRPAQFSSRQRDTGAARQSHRFGCQAFPA